MFFQRLDRCRREVHHLVVWVEAEEVYWDVRSQVVVEPPAQLASCLQAVTHLRYDQVSYFRVNLGLVSNVEQRPENRLSVRDQDPFSQEAGLIVSLEVYSYAVEEFVHHTNRVR